MNASMLTEKSSTLPSQPPLAPTVDQAYLQRLEALLAATEESVAVALDLGNEPTAGHPKKMALRVPC